MIVAEDDSLTKAELLAYAAERGVRVTSSQLKRLREVGLVPKPAVTYGGVRGAASRYPGWAGEQLVAVGRLRASERRFDELRLLVWWEDGWVDPAALRAALAALVRPVADEIGALLSRDVFEVADEMRIELAGKRARTNTSSLIKLRLPSEEDRQSMVTALLLLMRGEQPAWDIGPAGDPSEPSLAALLERASGLDRALRDPVGGEPWLEASEAPSVDALFGGFVEAGILDVANAERHLVEATDDELDGARLDIRLGLQRLGFLVQTLEQMTTADIGGVGSLRALAVDSVRSPSTLVWLLRTVVLLRRQLGPEPFARTRLALDKAVGPGHVPRPGLTA